MIIFIRQPNTSGAFRPLFCSSRLPSHHPFFVWLPWQYFIWRREGAPQHPSAAPHTSLSEVQTEIVNKHNTLRRGVQATASNMMKMVKTNEAEQKMIKDLFGCGENLYMAWYNKVANFLYGVGSINGGVVGHYTQVVWATSKNTGCAMAYCSNSTYKYFYVCHYCPQGNYNFTNPYKSGTSCSDCPRYLWRYIQYVANYLCHRWVFLTMITRNILENAEFIV
uniref:SCP domain-containing protein n=1 Tax=Xiphophorus maculatus TaxID=8083 RepID=A0A3B5QKR2_XIPMA